MKIEKNYVLIVLYNFLSFFNVGTKCQTLNISTADAQISSIETHTKNVEKYLHTSTVKAQTSIFTSTQTPLFPTAKTLIPLTTIKLLSFRNISQLSFTIPEATTVFIKYQDQPHPTSMTSNLLMLSESNSSSTPSSTSLMAEHASSTEIDNFYQTNTANCTETVDENCIIDHNITCVGEREYCNLTYDEYIILLYDYIYPTTPEWILICSHLVVFIMGLVSFNLSYFKIIFMIWFIINFDNCMKSMLCTYDTIVPR